MKSEKTETRGRGRPRNEGLRRELLLAARRLFVTYGESVSLDAIAREAETSRVTLYRHFASKEDLLNAMLVEEVTNTFTLAVEQLDPNQPRVALLKLARTYLDLVLERVTVENMTVLIAASKIDLKIPAAYHDTGPHALTLAFASYLARVPGLDIPDTETAAEQLLAMLRGNEQIRALLGLPPRRNAKQSAAYIESCVDTFLRSHARAMGKGAQEA